MPRLITALSLTLLVLIPALVAAQTAETGVVSGRILDSSADPVDGAAITAYRIDGSNFRDATTGSDGAFRFAFLPPGTYIVNVQAPGFAEHQINDLQINASKVTEIEIPLEPGEVVQEEVVVLSSAPLIDTRTTEAGSVLQASEIEQLPTSRTATDLLQFTPGVRPDQVWGGSTEQANSYQIDGVGVNQPGFGGDFLLPNVDWIQEIEVKGLGAGAEYGNFQGGLINMVTKSGGNELSGSVRFNYEDESLNSSTLDTLEAGEERDSRGEISADVAGPIVRDKLYYFVSVQSSDTATNIVDGAASTQNDVVFLPIQEERSETKIFGKLNADVTSNDRLSLVLGLDDVETDNRGLDSFTAPEAAQTQESPSVFYNASWQRVVNTNNYFELKFTGFDGEDDRLPLNGNIPATQILGGNRDLFTNATFTRDRDLTSEAATFGWDAFLATGRVDHQLKFGATWERGTWLEERRRNGGYSWRPEEGDDVFNPDDPATWGFISSDWGGAIRLDADSVNSALFVQDYMQLTSWASLNLGLRYGSWKGELTPGFGGGGKFTAVDDSAIAPRIGAVIDFARDGEWIGKVHWGRYYQNLFALMYDRAEGGEVFQDTEFWDWDAAGLPDIGRIYTENEREDLFVFFGSQPTGQEVGPVENWSQPYVDQLVLGIEKKLGDRSKIGLTYVDRANKDIVALVDRNLNSNYTLLNNISVIDFRSGDPVLDQNGNPLVLEQLWIRNDDILFVGSAPGLSDEQVDALDFEQDLALTVADEATRDMEQFQLAYDHRAERWSMSASLVSTDLTGNFFSVNGYESSTGIGAGAFVDRNEQTNFLGKLQNFSELEFRIRATGELPWKLRGGAFFEYAEGDRFAPVYEIDRRNHDFVTSDGDFLDPDLIFGISGETVLLEPRGNQELDTFTSLDLYLDRPFELGRTTLVVGVDVFNLFNDDAQIAVRELVNDQDPDDPTTLFGSTRLRQTPRTWRLNLSFRF